jgi:hypothetical protein
VRDMCPACGAWANILRISRQSSVVGRQYFLILCVLHVDLATFANKGFSHKTSVRNALRDLLPGESCWLLASTSE